MKESSSASRRRFLQQMSGTTLVLKASDASLAFAGLRQNPVALLESRCQR